MLKKSLTGLAVAAAGFALPLVVGAGVASATPDLGPAVNSTCTYPQLVSALNASDPRSAALLNGSPVMQAGLREFVASPADKRQRTAEQLANTPAFAPYLPAIEQAFGTCNNF